MEFEPFLPPSIRMEKTNLDYFPAAHLLGKMWELRMHVPIVGVSHLLAGSYNASLSNLS